jgi:hypothetical protein
MYYAIIHIWFDTSGSCAHIAAPPIGEAARKFPDAAYRLTLSRLAGNPRRDWERIGS